MKAFVTGATGFIGGRLAARLRGRGDEVVALVRSRARAGDLESLGCELVEGDLSATERLVQGMRGCDAAFHVAAVYKIGVPKDECAAMHEANVRGTENVLDAAIEAGVSRIVYVSTVGVFGNTRGEVLDESRLGDRDEFLSCYDETKYLAHQVARERIASGAPVVIAMPGGVYGPGDTSDAGRMVEQMATGRVRIKMFPGIGFTFVHVDDVVEGLLLAHERGKVGEGYVLGGEISTLGEVVDKISSLTGRKPPKLVMPRPLIRASVPLGPLMGKVMGMPPNLRETVRASDGVTYWASHAKAERDLGYAPRDLDAGLRDTLAARAAA